MKETGKNYAIWWTSNEETLLLGERPDWPPRVPLYIQEQYASRMGRNGRGRLWCSPGMPAEATTKFADADALQATNKAGGIVIYASDAQSVAPLPGFLTTLDLRWLDLTA